MEAAQLDRDDDDRGQCRYIDQNILHDGDRRRRAQPARVSEGGQHDKGNEQRQIGGKARPGYAERADDDLDADELQGDVRHGRDYAGHRYRQCQPAVPEAPANEITRRDVAMLAAHIPQAAKEQENERVDDDRIRYREKSDGTGAERERRNGNESVGGIDIATDQEPGDEGAETPAAQTPFVKQIEIAFAPMSRGESQPGY